VNIEALREFWILKNGSFASQEQKDYFKAWFGTLIANLDYSKAKNEQNMIAKNSWNQCLVIDLIHTLRFSTFDFFRYYAIPFSVLDIKSNSNGYNKMASITNFVWTQVWKGTQLWYYR